MTLFTVHQVKLKAAHEALKHFKNNRASAAKSLGITHKTLLDWIDCFDELKEFRKGITRMRPKKYSKRG